MQKHFSDTKTKLEPFLVSKLPGISRSLVKKLLSKNLVYLNGVVIKQNGSVKKNDQVEIDIDGVRKFIKDNDLYQATPFDMKMEILHEDDDSIIVNKPEGIATHPDGKVQNGTLLNGVIHYISERSTNPFVRVNPVHRLDRGTSGIILFSKNKNAHTHYARQFRKHEIQKTYLAIVKGDFQKFLDGRNEVIVENHISKKPLNRKYQITDEANGENARTDIYFQELVGEGKKYSLLKIIPHTGRTHQIRVHLASLGFPIVGDEIYGGEKADRIMLHAWKLKIKMYGKADEEKEFEAEIPMNFEIV